MFLAILLFCTFFIMYGPLYVGTGKNPEAYSYYISVFLFCLSAWLFFDMRVLFRKKKQQETKAKNDLINQIKGVKSN